MISPAIASLADTALLLPASVLLGGLLASLRQWRVVAAWLAGLAVAGGGTVAAKLAFHACGRALTDAAVVSPSGHASFAAVFYGAVVILLGAGRPRLARLLLGSAAALLVLAVGISRVRTGAHTPGEVLVGTAIGASGLAAFALLHARAGRPALPSAPVAAGFALALLAFGGAHVSFEHEIGRWARHIADRLDVCTEPDRARPSRSPDPG